MTRNLTLATLTLAASLFSGCAVLTPMQGDWEVELTDADDCTVALELEQTGDEVEGEADLTCRIYITSGGETYTYDMEEDGIEVVGEFDRDGNEFTLELEFYDSFFEADIEIVLEGELDEDELEGDAEINGEDWGEFEGELD
jgi:hypothetical protein